MAEVNLTRVDAAFVGFLSQRARLKGPKLLAFENLLVSLLQGQRQGNNCLSLAQPEQDLVLASGLVVTAEQANALPLVLEHGQLYLHRYWQYEHRLASQITQLAQINFSYAFRDENLARYFPDSVNDDGPDWQREAAKMALTQAICIITGGPGTGKTTTVVKILALLQVLSDPDQPLLIALAAPTGKATLRLQEAIVSNKAQLPCSAEIAAKLPEKVLTIHRLLGAKPLSPYFRHHAGQPLPYDLVVVDEASMIDLALMSKLVDALKPGARLILLGDKDQLASVESGAVLADLTQVLPKHTLELKKSHRFGGYIQELATAVNCQQDSEAWQLLNTAQADVTLLSEAAIDFIVGRKLGYLKLLKAGAGMAAVFAAFNRFQVLCSNWQGQNGVLDVNQQVEKKLLGLGLISAISPFWYVGRPVMVAENQPELQLFNGDIGICVADDKQSGRLIVVFQRADGSFKRFLPARMPRHETVFAMTIHKSQGSEFAEVLILLPDIVNPVLTKELLYTAITRAKTKVAISASESVLRATIAQKVQRSTGLAGKLLDLQRSSITALN